MKPISLLKNLRCCALLLFVVPTSLLQAQQPTGTGSSKCYNARNTKELCGPCETCPSCGASVSNSGSFVHNGRLGYHSWAYDFRLPSGTPGCGSCGSNSGMSSGLDSVKVKRHLNSRMWSHRVSSFGRVSALVGYDQSLKWPENKLESTMTYHEAGKLTPVIQMNWNPGRMTWAPVGAPDRAFGLTLFDAMGSPLTAFADRELAHTGVFLRADGRTVHFEIIRTGVTAYGRPIAFADRNGNITSVEYVDAQPAYGTNVATISEYFRRTKITDPYGRELLFEYTLQGNEYLVSKITHPDGQFTTYSYTSVTPYGNFISQVNHPDGAVTTHAWNHNQATGFWEVAMFEATAEPGKRRKTVHVTRNSAPDDNGVVIHTVAGQARMVLNGEGEMTHGNRATPSDDRLIFEGGNKAYVVGFSAGVSKQDEITDGAVLQTTFFTVDINTLSSNDKYDFNNNTGTWRETKHTDAFGRKELTPTRNSISLSPTRKEMSDGTSKDTVYNPFDTPALVTDRLGRVTSSTFDATGNLLSKTRGFGNASASTETWLYNAQGLVTEHRDPLYDANFPELHNTQYEYDANNFPTKKIHSADVAGGTRPETLYTWDSTGRLATVTDPEGRVVTYAYDVRSRLVTTTYSDTSTETVTYGTGADANLVLSRKDRNGIVTEYVYDQADRVTTTRMAAGLPEEVTEACTYLTGTRLKASCTLRGNKTDYAYDHQNRVVSTTRYPDTATALVSSTEYDVLGRVRSTTDPYGRKTYFLYDENDRVTRTVRETVPNGLAGVPAFSNSSSQTAQQVTRSITLTNGETVTLGGIHEVTYTDPRDLFLEGLQRDLTANAKYLITDRTIDAEGQILTTTDARGIESLQRYDVLGRVLRSFEAITLPEERLMETDYDDASNVTETRGPRYFTEGPGTTANLTGVGQDTYTYNGRNLRAGHTTAPGSSIAATESWTYYPDARPHQHTDFRGNTLTRIYHVCCGRLQAIVDRDGTSTTIYNTDYKGQPTHTAVVSPNPGGNWHDPVDVDTLQETTTRFDGLGRPTHVTRWLSPRGNIDDDARVSLGDPAGIPIAGLDSIPSADGLTTTYVYDDDLTDGVGLDVTYAAALTDLATTGIVFGAGSAGSAVETTNPEGEKTVQIRDGLGRTVMTVNPEGDASTMAYDAVGTPAADGAQAPLAATPVPGDLLRTSATDANGNTSSVYTDGASRTLATVDAAGNAYYSAHNANGSRVATRDPNGLGEDCTFDALNRDTSCADLQETAEGNDRQTAYNAASQIVSTTDAEGNVSTMEYDARGRRTSTEDANNITTSYGYDANSNLTSLTDGNNNTRTWDYGPRNLAIEKVYPGSGGLDKLEYEHDALRRITLVTDQATDTRTMVYDLAGRMTAREYRTGGTVLESTDTFVYDDADRVTQTIKGRHAITTDHTYAPDSMPLTQTVTADGRTYTMSRTYDAGNRPLTHSYPDGNATTWGYDVRNLVTTVSYDGENVVTKTHDDAARLTQAAYGNGLTRTIGYTRQDNLRTTDTTFDGGTAIKDLEFSYLYFADKQVSKETVATGGVVTNSTFTATYDDGNRLTSWDRPAYPAGTGLIPRQTQTWNFDDAGNWTSTVLDGTSQARNHNTADQLTSLAGNTATLDAKGNQLTFEHAGNDYELEYDLDNRLTRAEVDNDDVEYRYDAFGRRTIRKEGSDETALLWWGSFECAEYEHGAGQACIQNDIFCDPNTLNAVVARAVDGSKFKLEWYHKNYLDHVYAVSDDSGDLIEHYRYTAYGEQEIYNASGTLITTSGIGNEITWNTRRIDTLTSFYLYKYRHYAPQLGRWPSRDPIEEEGGVNLYGFIGNNATTRIDVLGLCYSGVQLVKRDYIKETLVVKNLYVQNSQGWINVSTISFQATLNGVKIIGPGVVSDLTVQAQKYAYILGNYDYMVHGISYRACFKNDSEKEQAKSDIKSRMTSAGIKPDTLGQITVGRTAAQSVKLLEIKRNASLANVSFEFVRLSGPATNDGCAPYEINIQYGKFAKQPKPDGVRQRFVDNWRFMLPGQTTPLHNGIYSSYDQVVGAATTFATTMLLDGNTPPPPGP